MKQDYERSEPIIVNNHKVFATVRLRKDPANIYLIDNSEFIFTEFPRTHVKDMYAEKRIVQRIESDFGLEFLSKITMSSPMLPRTIAKQLHQEMREVKHLILYTRKHDTEMIDYKV